MDFSRTGQAELNRNGDGRKQVAQPCFLGLSAWAFGRRNHMKNSHYDTLEPIRAIPFVFSTSPTLASGFSRLRLFHDPFGDQKKPQRNAKDAYLCATKPRLRKAVKAGLRYRIGR
jgi:hypothetical protein